ncbi:MAG: HDOD domain-containing protein [Oxalobacter sp.]|nr:MAG: HDOD domain-containing protein [Oxalobacter sp.]
MKDQNFVIREPLLDPRQQALGYELTWQRTGIDSGISNVDLLSLFAFVGKHLNPAETGWALGGNLLFLEAKPALLSSPFVLELPSKNVVLILNRADILDADDLNSVKAVRAKGYGILLRNANPMSPNKELMSQVTHIEVRCGEMDVSKLAKTYAALKDSPSVRMVARQVGSWQEYDACSALGLDAFVGKLHLTPRPGGTAKVVNPSQAMVLQLMDLVRKNADVHNIESVLKRDAALSYKLLRYINSAGFGLAVEVKSLRHAVGLIGYSPLYRWLSLLLASSSTDEHAAVLMQTAIIRGRLTELLGLSKLGKSDAENLFVTGMFSLLDRLLGVSMDEALKHISLPDAVTQALVSREGRYGPYLALAESCELKNGLSGALADGLSLPSGQVNEAHMASLSWAQNFTE